MILTQSQATTVSKHSLPQSLELISDANGHAVAANQDYDGACFPRSHARRLGPDLAFVFAT